MLLCQDCIKNAPYRLVVPSGTSATVAHAHLVVVLAPVDGGGVPAPDAGRGLRPLPGLQQGGRRRRRSRCRGGGHLDALTSSSETEASSKRPSDPNTHALSRSLSLSHTQHAIALTSVAEVVTFHSFLPSSPSLFAVTRLVLQKSRAQTDHCCAYILFFFFLE